MIIDFNEFLMALSYALDLSKLETGIKVNHGKRICYIALKICNYFRFSSLERKDASTIMLLHHMKSEKVEWIDLLSISKLDAFMPSSIKNNKLRLIQEILNFACLIDTRFSLYLGDTALVPNVLALKKEPPFSSFNNDIFDAFYSVSSEEDFWTSLCNKNINNALKKLLNKDETDVSTLGALGLMHMFCDIIDAKSGYTKKHSSCLTEKAEFLAKYFSIKGDELVKLIIAANLHDIGKLAIPTSILDKPKFLSKNEYEIIKTHPYYTRVTLNQISNFEDITEWASNHHEKLNGKGYPLGLVSKDLDFNSRLIACLDIYQALTEDRPYRRQLTHNTAIDAMKNMCINGELDGEIVKHIDHAFA